jgi:hypothetical protein
MDTNYFQSSFESMETSTIRLWLHEAQVRLPHERGSVREILKEGIRASARELLFRYREDMKRIFSKNST